MVANEFYLGEKFKNIHTGDTIVVVLIGDMKYFENERNGDIYDFVDEDMYVESK